VEIEPGVDVPKLMESWEANFASVVVILKLIMSGGHND
jgi:hypothetical protein